MDLHGRVCAITGGSVGIGRALAIALGERGASVALLARSRDGLNQTRSLVEARGGRARVYPTDLRDLHAIAVTAAAILEDWGRVDLIANVAGVRMAALLHLQEGARGLHRRAGAGGPRRRGAGQLHLPRRRGDRAVPASVSRARGQGAAARGGRRGGADAGRRRRPPHHRPDHRGAQPRRPRLSAAAGAYPTSRTSRLRGPWTPSTRLSSMSEVADGPDTKVIGRRSRAAASSAAIASGTVPTIWEASTTHRW